MDFLSTWVATPNMVLEGNPIAKKLGWKWGAAVNVGLCLGFALWPLPAVIISTTSVLVAARNFQGAWLMRTMGEDHYREWHVQRVQETRITLFLFCLCAQAALFALVGLAVAFFSTWTEPVVPGIGLGLIAYAAAVVFYTMLGLWRIRRGRKAPAAFVQGEHGDIVASRGFHPSHSDPKGVWPATTIQTIKN
jgi:hypothetical protein